MEVGRGKRKEGRKNVWKQVSKEGGNKEYTEVGGKDGSKGEYAEAVKLVRRNMLSREGKNDVGQKHGMTKEKRRNIRKQGQK